MPFNPIFIRNIEPSMVEISIFTTCPALRKSDVMHNFIKIIGSIIISSTLIGCLDTIERKELITNYYLLAIDLPDNMTLCYSDESGPVFSNLIAPTIFEVQWNERFIILKSHPKDFKASITEVLRNEFFKELAKDSTLENIAYTADTLSEKEYYRLLQSGKFEEINHKHKQKATIYYLLDTRNQNQDPKLFLTETKLKNALIELSVGNLPNRQYYEFLDKEK